MNRRLCLPLAVFVLLAACTPRTLTPTPTAPPPTAIANASATLPPTTTATPTQPTATASPTAVPPSATPAPPTAAPSATQLPPAPLTHTVQPGETLFRIGLLYGVTVDALRAANGLTGDLIYAGQVLTIPNGTMPATQPPPATGAPPATATTVPGDNLAWNPNPATRVVLYYNEYLSNTLSFIPNAVIWGDGRAFWAMYDRGGQRTVFAAQLSADQVRDFLQHAADAGFFDWGDTFGRESLHTAGDHLTITLVRRANQVSVYDHSTEAPAQYEPLTSYISANGPILGAPYQPTRAYLTVTAVAPAAGSVQWPDASGLTLDQVGAGKYVEGEALAFAWQTINTTPTQPLAVSNGQTYSLSLQIAGVTLQAPPP